MLTEHNIQIGVSIDEESIKNTIIKGAAQAITNSIFPKGFTERSFYGNEWSREYTSMMERLVEDFLSKNKEVLIRTTAEMLTERMMKSTALKKRIAEEVVIEK